MYRLTVLVMLSSVGGVATSCRTSIQGESCTHSGECGGGLLCFNGQCTVTNSGLASTGKVCVRLECRTEADCNGGSTCSSGQCVCARDADCGGFGKCTGGKCVQCNSDTDCSGNRVCVSGACTQKCIDNFDCQNFYSCSAGRCAFTGCTTNRECVVSTHDVRAKCDDGTKGCFIGCAVDAECNQNLTGSFGQICNKGRCENLGCENTFDCELFFPTGTFGECRAPTAP